MVLTGGEPLLHYKSKDLQALLQWREWGWVGLETSGFVGYKMDDVQLGSFLDCFNTVCLSPKITPCLHGRQTDGELEQNIQAFLRPTVMAQEKLCLKFVVRDQLDVDAILRCRDRHCWGSRRVYVMPFGISREDVLKGIEWLIPLATREGWFVTPRLHTILWGAERLR